MALFGICASNKPGDTGYDTLLRLQPRYVVLMEGQVGMIRDLERGIPGVRTALRAEDAGRAWDPYKAYSSPEQYAEDFADLMREWRPKVGIPWNEANVEWLSLFTDPSNCTPEQYGEYARWSSRFLIHYQNRCDVPIQWPALSPGHRTDDFEQSSRILAPTAALFDEIGFHFYYPDFTEWSGQRYLRELPFYRGTGKPLVCTETNRPFNRNDSADVARMVEDTRRFYQEADPSFQAICYFIENSASFPGLNSRDVELLESLFYTLARKEPAMPEVKPTTITAMNRPTVIPGGTAIFTFLAAGIDGVGKGYADLAYADKPDGEFTWGPNSTVELPYIHEGLNSVEIHCDPSALADVPYPQVGKLRLRLLEQDGVVWDAGVYGPFAVDIISAVPVSQPVPVQPAGPFPSADMQYRYDQMWTLRDQINGDAVATADDLRFAAAVTDLIKWRKGEIPYPFK